MYAAGFYSYSIFALIFWETRRSDFGVSMSHHVATVILIVLSYIFRYLFHSLPFCLVIQAFLSSSSTVDFVYFICLNLLQFKLLIKKMQFCHLFHPFHLTNEFYNLLGLNGKKGKILLLQNYKQPFDRITHRETGRENCGTNSHTSSIFILIQFSLEI